MEHEEVALKPRVGLRDELALTRVILHLHRVLDACTKPCHEDYSARDLSLANILRKSRERKHRLNNKICDESDSQVVEVSGRRKGGEVKALEWSLRGCDNLEEPMARSCSLPK